ncbi:biotin transporter BioY [Enterovirga sp. DB1703]|uniref:Biotin transporter n=2 Tax=Enterovirga aerilata TaxID=2730920 RepID=A0A849ILP3_9HYPH|nr:biotin transporter BioY [Enterovirga sp. DB1703]
MSESAAPVQAPATSVAALLWPSRSGRIGAVRAVLLAIAGACLLTISAKVQVPGPVPMTLQTLAVLGLGAALGLRLAVASVGLYLLQGALGLPVFANTPPLAPGLAYFAGPTGGFLAGFLLSAAIVGAAADRGLMRRPGTFAVVLAGANAALLACGWVWLALAATVGTGSGVGFGRAFALGVQPFLLGEAIKVALAALAFPLVYRALAHLVRR